MKKLTKKTSSVLACRPLPNTVEWLEKMFSTKSEGAGFCLDSLRGMFQNEFAEMRGRFSEGELSLMLDVMNGTVLTAGMTGAVSCNVSDCAPDGTPEKWGVDLKSLCKKMDGLNSFQNFCLDVWAHGFWDSGFYEGENAVENWNKMIL